MAYYSKPIAPSSNKPLPSAVVVCTRDRPDFLRETIRSILASTPAPELLVIVDQADPAAPDPLGPLAKHPSVLRLHHRGTGLSRARNIGTAAAAEAGATIVAYTDDDCTVEPSWLEGLAAMFAAAPDVALVFGSTLAAPHDPALGMIPAYQVAKLAVHRGLVNKPRVEGMGACMAVRVVTWRRIGGFDDHLGAGTPLAAAEENDLSIRLLNAGLAVAETPAAVVIHHGLRDREAASALVAGYMRGSGAATAKLLRLGGLRAVAPLLWIGKRWVLGQSAVTLGHMPPRRVRLHNFLSGVRLGWQKPLDSHTGRFQPFLSPEDLRKSMDRDPGASQLSRFVQ